MDLVGQLGRKRGPYKGRAEYSSTTAAGLGSDYRRMRLVVLNRDSWTCQYCGRPASTADHVIPRKLGGQSTLDNMVAACRRCNCSKQDRIWSPVGFRRPGSSSYGPGVGGPSEEW